MLSLVFPPPSKKRIYNSALKQLLPSFSHQEKVNKIKPPLPDCKPWSQGVGVVALRKLPKRDKDCGSSSFSLKLEGAPGSFLDWNRNTQGTPLWGAAHTSWKRGGRGGTIVSPLKNFSLLEVFCPTLVPPLLSFWRLPSIHELLDLSDCPRSPPAAICMCTAYCLSPVCKLYKLCFLISPSALFWGGGYSSFGITFPPPMCFPSFEIFWPLVLFGRGKGDNSPFSVSLVFLCTLLSVVSLVPFSCLFCRCVGLGYAAGQISHQSSNMPAESGKRFKPSKYVPVSAAAIFLVGATTLFFAFTWVFSLPAVVMGGLPGRSGDPFFSLEFGSLLAKPSD